MKIRAIRLRTEGSNRSSCLKIRILEDTPLVYCLHICYICLFINIITLHLCSIVMSRTRGFGSVLHRRCLRWDTDYIGTCTSCSLSMQIGANGGSECIGKQALCPASLRSSWNYLGFRSEGFQFESQQVHWYPGGFIYLFIYFTV